MLVCGLQGGGSESIDTDLYRWPYGVQRCWWSHLLFCSGGCQGRGADRLTPSVYKGQYCSDGHERSQPDQRGVLYTCHQRISSKSVVIVIDTDNHTQTPLHTHSTERGVLCQDSMLHYWPDHEKKVTYLCVVRLLLDSTTVLEGLFGEYHSSSAALGKQRLGVTTQPPFGDRWQQQHPNIADV